MDPSDKMNPSNETGEREEGLLSDEPSRDSIQGGNEAVTSSARSGPGGFRQYFCSMDFAELVLCFVFALAGAALDFFEIEPNQRPIPYIQLEDGEFVINQVYNEIVDGETVSTAADFVYAGLIPFVLQMILSYFAGNKNLHKTACVYFGGLGLTVLLTNSIKLYVGYLRPIFFDVCEPDEDYAECTSGNDRSVRLSFPSGHASFSFCGFSLFSFYLEARYGISSLRLWTHDSASGLVHLAYKKPVGFARILSIFCYIPMVIAGFIAASRVHDNKHFPADVVGGSVLGFGVASLIHSIWFPSWPTVDESN